MDHNQNVCLNLNDLCGKKLLVAPGISTSGKELVVTKGIATRSKDATCSSWPYLGGTSASLLVTRALLLVARSY